MRTDIITLTEDKVTKHRKIVNDMNTIYAQKNHDYGDSFGKTFKQLGIISAVTRITDKYNRLVSLVTKGNQQVSDESIKDTLMDMANYCVMTIIELEENNNEN